MTEPVELPFLPNQSVDAVIYMALLVSDAKAIDPIMDPVRIITARQNFSSDALSADDLANIRQVYMRLETYLTEQDPQRVFTQEELRQKIRNHFDALNPETKRLRKMLWVIAGITCAFGALGLLVPQAPTEDSAVEFYSLLILPLVFTMLHFGAAWMFGSALQHFRSQLQQAYRRIVVGVVVLGIAQAQMVIIGAFDWWNTFWINDGLITILYIPAFTLMNIGMRRFARSVGVAVPSIVIPLCVALAIGSGFVILVPHTSQSISSEFFYRLSSLGMLTAAVIAGAAAISGQRIHKAVTKLYQKPLWWLTAGFWGLSFAASHFLFVHLFVGYDTWYVDYGFVLLPFLASALMVLRAGYRFNKASRY
jgi:hypothetical protein